MNTTKKKLPVLLAGFFAFASSAMSAEQTLPTPPLSEFVDAESSVNVPIPTDEGRHLNLTLAFEPTPSNAVLVAFGRDLNGSETLEPEETEIVVGVDCGVPVVRDEVKERGEGVEVKVKGEGEQWNGHVPSEEQEGNHHCSPSPSPSSSPSS